MKWFNNLQNKYRVLIAVASWIPLLLTCFIDLAINGESAEMSDGLAFVVVIFLAVGIVFTVLAARARDKEKKAEKEKAAQAQAEAEAKRRAEIAASMSGGFSVRIVGGRDTKDTINFPIHTKARGVTFGGRQEFLQDSEEGDSLIIKHAPTPEYPDTIAIINERTGKQLGNIGADLAASLLGEFGEGCTFCGVIQEITGGEDDKKTLGCNLTIEGVE